MIDKESNARMIGYGAMLTEGLVGIVALVAATSLLPGDYFAMNIDQHDDQSRAAYVQFIDEHSGNNLDLHPQKLDELTAQTGEKNLRGRTGGAVTLAVGIAQIFAGLPGLKGLMKYWYHFAIMFEALFILSTIDTGTRVARFMLGEFLGRAYRRFEHPDWLFGAITTSALVVFGWAYFILTGSISTIWPMFGIANQLLAAIALAVGTSVIINEGRAKYAWVTLLPMSFVSVTTLTAGWESIFQIFLKDAHTPDHALRGYLDTGLTMVMMACVVIVLLDSIYHWRKAIKRQAQARMFAAVAGD